MLQPWPRQPLSRAGSNSASRVCSNVAAGNDYVHVYLLHSVYYARHQHPQTLLSNQHHTAAPLSIPLIVFATLLFTM